ncbi:MAG: HAD family acid phosphatase [Thermaurantiacus sp.]
MRSLPAIALLLLCGCATAPAVAPAPAALPASALVQPLAWTYGSAEAAMQARQSFAALLAHVETLRPSPGMASAIAERLEDGRAVMRRCTAETARRPAVVFDVDETLVWNIGHQQWQARTGRDFDPAIWAQWERAGGPGLVAVPGAVETVRALRALGITPIFITNRAAAHAAETARDLDRLGLGPALHRETLFLDGDAQGGSRKHHRREVVAARFCVLAQAGDQMGDFADAIDFDASGNRRPAAHRVRVAGETFGALWNRGWFLIPNPMYGRWNQPPLTLDEVVPADWRWAPEEMPDAMDP